MASGERIAIVTGANRGIGRQVALELARRGMTVVMACRNLQTSLSTRDEIRRASGNGKVDLLPLDLADTRSIRAFASAFGARYGVLHVLVNNAGIITKRSATTVDGFNLVIGTNFFGPYLLTRLLLPFFEEGGDDRIVNVSSVIYPYGGFDFDKVPEYRWFKAYAVSKYMIVLFTRALSAELLPRGISVNAVDPGVVRTAIFHPTRWFKLMVNTVLRLVFIPVKEGARSIVHLAASDEVRGTTGKLFKKCKEQRIGEKYDDREKAEDLVRRMDALPSIGGAGRPGAG